MDTTKDNPIGCNNPINSQCIGCRNNAINEEKFKDPNFWNDFTPYQYVPQSSGRILSITPNMDGTGSHNITREGSVVLHYKLGSEYQYDFKQDG